MVSTSNSRTVYFVTIVFLCCAGLSIQCGPGRRQNRNQPRRRISPLVYKQYSPPLSEETLGASGQAEGAIKRGDVRFKNLVENHNTDIIYRDEERDGSDRIMSKRCKEMLDRLAVLVQNEWPGDPPEVPPVKLKVKEAWDDKYVHGENSLHYEGRAVDVATNDRDRSKLGMLAALAVTAGFDWVFYESHGHIHCSVKSDSSAAVKIGGCFSKDSTVEVENLGTISMAELEIGHKVLSMTSGGKLQFSEILSFMDRNDLGYGIFYTLFTETGKRLTLTAKHLVHVLRTNSSNDPNRANVIFADNVKEGDYLLTTEKNSIHMERVTHIKVESKQGVYAPLTREGTLVVNSVVASCYAYIDNVFIAHSAFAPMRIFHDISQYMPSANWFKTETVSTNKTATIQTGIHWYARLLYNIGTLIFSPETLYVH